MITIMPKMCCGTKGERVSIPNLATSLSRMQSLQLNNPNLKCIELDVRAFP